MLSYLYNLKLKTLCSIVILSIFSYFIVQVILLFVKTESQLPILVWWTPFMPKGHRIISCNNELYRCSITNDRSNFSADIGAYLFYGSHIENDDFPLPRKNDVLWAVFHEESPKNCAPFLFKETHNLFNVTSTFSRYSDVAVTLQYLTNLSLIKDTKYYVPLNIKNQYLNEIAPVLYIQSDCDTPVDRDYFVKELGKYVKIDSYGKCLNNKIFPKRLSNLDPFDLYNEDFLNFISNYKFVIAFENSICDDYITEKLWRPLIVGSIPIYLGSPTVQDWLPNNNSAIVVKSFESLKAVGHLIQRINKNDTMYESFLEHKLKSKITNDFLKANILDDHPVLVFECSVCEKLHSNNNYFYQEKKNIYDCPKPRVFQKENTWYQHWDIGKCQSKALKLLISRNKPYSRELFDQTWKTLLYNNSC